MLTITNTFILCCSLALDSVSAETLYSDAQKVTFANVTVTGYQGNAWQFNVTTASSNSLKDFIYEPKIAFDRIEIRGKIPILWPNAVSDLATLDEIDLQFNGLREIHKGAFRNMPYFRALVITDNDLEEIREGVLNGLEITTLDLSRNRIVTVAPGAFDDMPNLYEVFLRANMISRWNEDWFATSPWITKVDFQHNLIDTIQANAFENLKNDRDTISGRITMNIVLSHNRISKIDPAAFRVFDRINILELDHNQIENWNEDLLKYIRIRELRLDHNQISCVDGDPSKIFVADTTLIDDNPWDCDCLETVQIWAGENARQKIEVAHSAMRCIAQNVPREIVELVNRRPGTLVDE